MNPVSKLINKNLVKNFFARNYAFKSDLKIKWVRPEKIPCIRAEKSGDLERKPEIDKTLLRYEFRDSKELENADENVRKLFTLEFAPTYAVNKVYREGLIDRVKRHELDVGSVEAKIARWTGKSCYYNHSYFTYFIMSSVGIVMLNKSRYCFIIL